MNVSRKPIACITIALMFVCTLHSGEVALTVTSGEKTLAQALSDEAKTLGGDDDWVKMGSGTLKILAASDVANGALPSSYSGTILVREGVLYRCFIFGSAAAAAFTGGPSSGVGLRELSPTEPVTKAGFGAVITVPDRTWRAEP